MTIDTANRIASILNIRLTHTAFKVRAYVGPYDGQMGLWFTENGQSDLVFDCDSAQLMYKIADGYIRRNVRDQITLDRV